MSLSRRQFFARFRDVAEGPEKWRERRIRELKDYGLKKAPAEWTQAQREELARTIDEKLIYMSDDTLRDPGATRYVDAMIDSRNEGYASEAADDGSLPDPYLDNNNDYLG